MDLDPDELGIPEIKAEAKPVGTQQLWFPSWAQIGGVLGGVAALVAILQFFGLAKISDFSLPWKPREVSGLFVSFRDTDFQISLQNNASENHFIGDAELLLESSTQTTTISLNTCCTVDANVLPSGQDNTLFLRSRSSSSNFDFYHDVLLPFENETVSGHLLLNLSSLEGTAYSLRLPISTEQLTFWKNEKIHALNEWCESSNGTKPRWCV
jgi:hypothetical protein